MPKAKIAISIDERTLHRLDRLIEGRVYSNRSRAIEEALEEKLSRLERRRLAEECARLDPDEERALAEEGLQDAAWPDY